MTQQNNLQHFPRYLWFLQLSYTAVILLANWFDIRMISIAGLDTDAGTIIFPITFILADLITEVYGYKFARRAIWVGFLFNLLFITYAQIIIHLPSPSYALETNVKFDELLGFNARIILASSVSYLCAEPLNSMLMAKLKMKMNGHKMAVRFVASTLIASLFDSFIFGSLAFAGTMSTNELIKFNLTMWFIKVVIEILILPLSTNLANYLKRKERLDIYDYNTNFGLFNLNAEYADSNNKFVNQ